MIDYTFMIKSVHAFFVLTICMKVTSGNIVIYRGSKSIRETRDFFKIPKVACQQVQNAYCSTEDLMTCYCKCDSYYYKDWNKCVRSQNIHKKEGCLEYVQMNPQEDNCVSNLGLLKKTNGLMIRRPSGYENCHNIISGRHANTQFLDCRGKWNDVTPAQALRTFISSIGPYNNAIIKLNKTGPKDLAGKMVKVAVKCYNRTEPRQEKVTCALLRVNGKMSCSLQYSKVSSDIVVSRPLQPQSTTPSATRHLPTIHQNKLVIIIPYVGYVLALVFGIGFIVTIVLLIKQRKLLRSYKREKPLSCTKNIYGPAKQEINLNEDYDDVLPHQLQQIPKSVSDCDTDDYEEVANDRQNPTAPFYHPQFGYKNWQEILGKMKTTKNEV